MTKRSRMGLSMARTPETVKAQGEHCSIGTKQENYDGGDQLERLLEGWRTVLKGTNE